MIETTRFHQSVMQWLEEKFDKKQSEPQPTYRHFCHHVHDEQGNLTIITRKIKLEDEKP